MREGKTYRDHMEELNKRFGGKQILKWKEVVEYSGRGYEWCCNHIDAPHRGCTVVQLARALEKLG